MTSLILWTVLGIGAFCAGFLLAAVISSVKVKEDDE